MKLLVTGASGFIGSALVADLLRSGHEVRGVVRSDASSVRVSELGATPVAGGLEDPASLVTAANRVDGVVHLAFRHGSPLAEAAASDREAIEAIGESLAGSERPLVITSGTLVLPAGPVGTEADRADPDAPAGARSEGERAALALAGRGVRSAVVRLAPSVHDRVPRGFVGALIDAARRSGFSDYIGSGEQRWPAVHRQDAARLFRRALESAPAGAVLHGVGESGVTLRAIAERIGAHLEVPASAVPAEDAEEHFGWIAGLVGTDAPATSERTQSLLDWKPTHPGLLKDLDTGDFFAAR
ncbi:MAG: SDR family oxidoreductase [Solirubrobacterales bacterium]|nr:SDR family oxidoreductase [Solirubrobacterales bacterium]